MKKFKLFLIKVLKISTGFLTATGLYKIIPYRNKLYDFFFRHSWPYGDVVEVQGSKMHININEEDPAMRKTLQAYAINRIHEETTTNLFKRIVRKGDVVIDLGANIGYFTLLAARLVGQQGIVFAFEPEPKNYSYLIKNIELNNYKQATAFQKAVSDKNGKIKLFICGYDSGHHTINRPNGIDAYREGRKGETKEIEIDAVSLNDFLGEKERKIDVIKMDVEGAEMLALLGMDKILKTNQNLKMFVEFFPLLIEKMGNSPKEFIRKLLEDYKFSIYVIPDDYNALKGETIKIDNIEGIMKFRKNEEDHINLFLQKDRKLTL